MKSEMKRGEDPRSYIISPAVQRAGGGGGGGGPGGGVGRVQCGWPVHCPQTESRHHASCFPFPATCSAGTPRTPNQHATSVCKSPAQINIHKTWTWGGRMRRVSTDLIR